MFKIEINKMGGASFQSEYEDDIVNDFTARAECKRILKEVLAKLDSGYNSGPCMDACGNKVGEWSFEL